MFVLKGKNAIGNLFVIPWQRVYDNSDSYRPTPYASFDIVATQNNTVIKVKPTRPIVGHEQDTVITVKLNRGETYSFKKTTLLASSNPSGTVVTSNKPVAITVKDDSVIKNGCRDLLGDQLIPVKVTGMEYVVPKGFPECSGVYLRDCNGRPTRRSLYPELMVRSLAWIWVSHTSLKFQARPFIFDQTRKYTCFM